MDIDPAWMISVYLISLRIGALLVMTPIFSAVSGFAVLRVLFALALGMLLVSGLQVESTFLPRTTGSLIASSIFEIGVGATLGFGVFAAFGAFALAGKLLDLQAGFGIGNIFDPVSRTGAPLFSTILNLLAVTAFFGLGGHHAFIRGIAFSIDQLPPGGPLLTLLSADTLQAVLRQFGLMFTFSAALIAPVMCILLLLDTMLAVMSRVLPQMNLLVISMPAKIGACLAAFAISAGSLNPAMAKIFASIFQYWQQVGS
jgi:flagellar biosynthetic protein FliR